LEGNFKGSGGQNPGRQPVEVPRGAETRLDRGIVSAGGEKGLTTERDGERYFWGDALSVGMQEEKVDRLMMSRF